MDTVRELVAALVREQGKNLSELSRQIGKNHAYLQQYLKRGIPQKLDEDVRGKLALALGIPEETLRQQNAGASFAALRNGNVVPLKKAPDSATKPSAGMSQSGDRFIPIDVPLPGGNVEMPLYRFAQGGKASPILENEPFEQVSRPDYLMRSRDPYGVMVQGTSMVPEYQPGWIAYIDPNLTARTGDTCIFRGEQADGSQIALIKVLRRETDTHWHVEQHNPPRGGKKMLTLKKSEYQVAHVTTGTDKRRR